MSEPLRILIVEDSEDDVRLLVQELRMGGYDVQFECVITASAMREALVRQAWDVVVADFNLPAFTGMEALRILRESGFDTPFILVSGTIGEETAVAAMKAGAHDYLMKGNLFRLVPAVRRELSEARVRRQNRLAEQQLRQLSSAVKQSRASIIITDLAGNIEYVNPSFSEMTGYASAEVIGSNPRFLKSGKTPPEEYRQLWEAITGGHDWQGEFCNRKKNGEFYWELAMISPICDADGRITHFLAIKEDITERKLQDQKMREQAALLDKAQDAIWVQDLDGHIQYWNTSAGRIFGWTLAETADRLISRLLNMNLVQYENAIRTVLEKGDWHGELAVRTKSGLDVSVEARWTLVRNEQEQPKSILAINTDITEKKQFEAQLLRAQRMESLGTLAGGIAHDLNNILTPLMFSVQMLKDKSTDPALQKTLETLETNVQRGASLVRHVLGFGRGMKGERIPINPKHIATEIRHIINETFPKAVAFEFYAAPQLWCIIGDPTQLHQVLLNLCVNARDAMPDGGKLSLRMENVKIETIRHGMNLDAKVGAYVLVTVTDNGSGIPKEVQDRIFDPFFTTKELGKGTGLGLSTTLAIVKSHGGFIDFTSTPGHGSCFQIYLPANGASRAGRNSAASKAQLPGGNNELVLVVDDEEPIRKLAETVLKNFGYRVLLAADGTDALALYQARQQEIAVVITDMIMPKMDGPATIVGLKCMNPKVKIICSTGMASESGMALVKESGIHHFIPKPYTTETMLCTLSEILKEQP